MKGSFPVEACVKTLMGIVDLEKGTFAVFPVEDIPGKHR